MILLVILLITEPLHLSLEKATEIALKQSPLLKDKYYLTQYNRVSFITSLGNLFVSPDITGSYSNYDYLSGSFSTSSDEYYTLNMGVETSVLSPASLRNVFSSYTNFHSTRLQFEYEKQKLIYDVKTQYLNTLRLKHLLDVYKNSIKRAELYHQLVLEKYGLGSASKLDLLKAEVELKKAQIEKLNLEKNYKSSLNSLLRAIGLRPQEEVILEEVEIKDSIESVPSVEEIESIALRSHPLLKQIKALYNDSRINFAYSFLSLIPSVRFGYYWDYSGTKLPGTMEDFTEKRGWSVSLSFNFFNYPASIIMGNLYRKQKDAYYKQMIFEVINNVRDAYYELINAKESIALAKARLEQAREAHNLAREQYKLGEISLLELLDAEESLKNAEVSYIETLYNLEIAKQKLAFYTGREVVR